MPCWLLYNILEVYVGSSAVPDVMCIGPLVFLSCMYNHHYLMCKALMVQDYKLEIRYKKGCNNVL